MATDSKCKNNWPFNTKHAWDKNRGL